MSDLEGLIDKLASLGFRLDTIMPADDPRVALLSGHGARVRVELERLHDEAKQPSKSDGEWKIGRASMQYRDLIPDRLGGRMIASHIKITRGGLVPDYVHFHEVDFQLIHVRRGWVRLVYEDQGPPFVLSEGQTVLQPPRIRHRVLESAPGGLEVIEIGSPASHPTHSEHELTLPTKEHAPRRDFDGQRFIVVTEEEEASDTFYEATGGRVKLRVLSAKSELSTVKHDLDVYFGFVREGSVTLRSQDGVVRLERDRCFTFERANTFELADPSEDFSLLEVRARLS